MLKKLITLLQYERDYGENHTCHDQLEPQACNDCYLPHTHTAYIGSVHTLVVYMVLFPICLQDMYWVYKQITVFPHVVRYLAGFSLRLVNLLVGNDPGPLFDVIAEDRLSIFEVPSVSN